MEKLNISKIEKGERMSIYRKEYVLKEGTYKKTLEIDITVPKGRSYVLIMKALCTDQPDLEPEI